jgi:hypothetical protein
MRPWLRTDGGAMSQCLRSLVLLLKVNSVNQMSNLDFLVLDCELLHTPWKVIELD